MELVVGQISFPKRKELRMNIPVTEIQMQSFDLAAFEIEVAAMTRKMPVFHSKDVQNFMKLLLVSGVAGQSKQQNLKLNKSEKFSKSCKTKHPAGKHTQPVGKDTPKCSAAER